MERKSGHQPEKDLSITTERQNIVRISWKAKPFNLHSDFCQLIVLAGSMLHEELMEEVLESGIQNFTFPGFPNIKESLKDSKNK